MSIKQRFISKVRKSKNTTCLIWVGYRDRQGYGILYTKQGNKRAARLAYELFVAKIPKGYHVLHRCDNPPCVNPRHLFLGTNMDNVVDKCKKNRAANTKLTSSDITFIRDYKEILPQVDLAKMFGVGTPCISEIINNNKRKHITV